MASMARRNAWDFDRAGSRFSAAKVRVVRRTAASERTGQCDTRSERAPAKKKDLARPDRPSAPGLSPAALLHADSTTQSASSFNCAMSLAVRRPLSSGPVRDRQGQRRLGQAADIAGDETMRGKVEDMTAIELRGLDVAHGRGLASLMSF